eukprot:6187643-Pleurochrysis_carterae.AAC.1
MRATVGAHLNVHRAHAARERKPWRVHARTEALLAVCAAAMSRMNDSDLHGMCRLLDRGGDGCVDVGHFGKARAPMTAKPYAVWAV